jgi:TolB-like protein
VRRDGYIKVLDFGIAKLSNTTPQLDVTEPGRVMGTINYMSPEQALGKPLDHRTDIFSLGVVLYEIATGRRLFDGDSEASIYDHILNRAPARMREIDPALPAEFELVVRRALEKDPERRYQSAAELRNDLKRLAQGNGETEAARLAASAQRTLRRSHAVRISAGLTAAAIVVSAAFFFGSRSTVHNDATPAAKEFSRKSVAVLPFENLTRAPENDSFTEGVQDQILTDLTQVSELKTISRTSVMRYPAGERRDLRAIGQQLGVAYLLEGSVQRAGEKVRVNAQLVDAAKDEQVWAETYDRELADFFVIQSEIATAIAGQLRARISPAQKAEIERQPTHDLNAFRLYTRGRTLVNAARSGDNPEANFDAAVRLLAEAAQLDPNFLAAQVELARAHASIALSGIDNTPASIALAETAVAAARRISPQSGDTHLAAAATLYATLNYAGAREELELARRTLPNDPRIFEMSAFINRRQGRWKECTQDFERLVEFDPLNPDALQSLAETYEALHRYPDWAATLDRAIALRPAGADLRFTRADVHLYERADTRRLRAEIEAKQNDDQPSIKAPVDWRLVLAFSDRDFVGIANALADLGDRHYGFDWARFSRAFGQGLLARMSGDERGARQAFATDRIAQLAVVQAQPDYGPAVSMLGLIEAGLGNKEEALRLGRRAVELLPVEKDSIRGPYMIAHLAIIAAWVGEKDLALEQMRLFEKLTPAGFHYGKLKLDPMWDPLRGDPRFEAIVAAHAPKDAP